jgi:hypothetical protein
MINSIESYIQAGRNAGRAHRVQDTALYNFERRWFNAAIALESDADKPAIQAAYQAAYKAARGLS